MSYNFEEDALLALDVASVVILFVAIDVVLSMITFKFPTKRLRLKFLPKYLSNTYHLRLKMLTIKKENIKIPSEA